MVEKMSKFTYLIVAVFFASMDLVAFSSLMRWRSGCKFSIFKEFLQGGITSA